MRSNLGLRVSLGALISLGRGAPTQGGGVVEPTLRPASYVKAIPNEYNGGAGLGSAGKQVGGHCHFPIMVDMLDGSHEVRFWHGGASAGQGEWNTGGTMKVSCSLLWIDSAGALQITTYNDIKDTAQGFEETIHRHPAIRPKLGSHALLTYFAEFTNSGYYSHARADYAQGEALRYATSGLPNYVGTNSIYSDTYNGAGDFWGPSFFGWSGGDLSIPTGVVGGDSNHSGVLVGSRSDVPDTLDGAIGSVARILLPFMPLIDISVPGGRASEMSDASKMIYRDRIGGKKRGRVLIPAVGTNDVIFNSDSEATLDSNVNAYASRQGFDLVLLPTIPPVVTSQASNTVYNAGRDPVRRARNATLRGRSNVMDIALGTESAGTPGTLQVLGDTIDGTHFNAQGNKRAATGAGFNVPAKVPGAVAINVGFQYPAGALYQSLRFNAGWTGQQATLTLDQAYSPEHKRTAALVKEDAATNNHAIFSQQTVALASTTKKVTAFIKRSAGSRNAKIQIQQNGGSYQSSAAVINLSTGALIFKEDTAGTVSGYTSVLTEDGFWKVEFSIAFGAGHPASSFFYVKMADAAGNDNYAGDNTSSIAVWGFDIR